MATTYGKLLLAVYELEGLLLVLEKHGDDTPASVVELIKQKAAFVAEEAQSVQFPDQSSEEEMLDAALDETDDTTDVRADVAQDEVVEEAPADEPEEISFAEVEAVAEPAAEAEEAIADEEPPMYVKCPQCGKVLPMGYTFCNECGCALGADEANNADEEAVPVEDEAAFVEPEEEVTAPAAYADDDEEFEEVETEDEEEITDDEDYDDIPDALSIEEKLHRGIAKNMRSAFSLNDSIRFRRELFGGSQAEYNDALDMVQSMHSFGEAEEYFYDDLAWDPTSDDVKDFMEVVRKHFL